MKITGDVIHHESQRYPTVGDWYFDKDHNLIVTASSLVSERMEFLIMLHEIVEAYLCRVRNISEKDVTHFDKHFKGTGEPGDCQKAPYHKEHFFATTIERMMAAELQIDWSTYEKELNALDK